jgi:tryptophan-rich sensory protein
VASLVLGGINAFLALPQIPAWLDMLQRPAFLPPDPDIVPVILFVYLLLGVILFLLWQASRVDRQDKALCLALVGFTLILMGLWGYLFFGLRSPFMGVMISVFVIAILIAAMVQALKVSFGATMLLFPVVIIIFLAAYANYVIVQLNQSLPIFGFS